MNFILLEKVFTGSATAKSKAVHYSINSWIRSFAEALAVEHNVTLIGHKHDPYFPKGQLFPGHESELDKKFNQRLIKYLNLPMLRHKTLTSAYLESIDQAVCELNDECVLISFCNNFAVDDALRSLSNRATCKIINLVLDWPTPTVDWSWYLHRYPVYDGHVFISKWCVDNYPEKQAFHFEGLLPRMPSMDVNEDAFNRKILLYTGKFNVAGGLDEFLTLFSKIGRSDIRLLVTTPNPCNRNTNKNVEYLGMLDEEELERVMSEATAFLSPYLPDHHANLSRFPSKSLKYMAYCKPLLSTITPGCSPNYQSYVSPFDIHSESSVLSALGRVFDCSYVEYYQQCEKNYALLQGEYSNQHRIQDLVDWIKGL